MESELITIKDKEYKVLVITLLYCIFSFMIFSGCIALIIYFMFPPITTILASVLLGIWMSVRINKFNKLIHMQKTNKA